MGCEISVVIAAYNASSLIGDCLRSLERQTTSRVFETIVVDSSMDRTGDLVAETFPNVRLFRFSKRKFPGGARNVGIDAAQGNVVAFLDADCRAEEDWLERVAEAHTELFPAIGGSIGNVEPSSDVGWAAYFTEFSHWMPAGEPRWIDDMAEANISYKREVFEKCGRFIEGTYCSDTEFHWRLGRSGYRLRFDPSIRVSHQSIADLGGFIRHEYRHGRAFGRIHVRGRRLSRWNKAAKVIGAPLCPARMLATIIRNNLENRVYLRKFVKVFPLVVAGALSWSSGQVTSYATE